MKTLSIILLLVMVKVAVAQEVFSSKMMQLDSLYEQAKDPKKQLEYSLEMLAVGQNELDIKDTTYANILSKVGLTYNKLRDKEKAIQYMQQAIDIHKVKAPQSLSYAKALGQLGVVYYSLSQYAKVEQLFLKLGRIQVKILGEEHPKYANTIGNLALNYQRMGLFEKAEMYYKKAIVLRGKSQGGKHPDYAHGVNNLGSLYNKIGKYEEAEKYYLKAAEIRKEVLGREHPDYASSLNNLGLLYYYLGAYEKSASYLLQSLAVRKKVLGEEHIKYARSLVNLGLLYSDVRDYPKAISFARQALDLHRKLLGKNHLACASILDNLGAYYARMKKNKEAELNFLNGLEIIEEVLGGKHPSYANSVHNLSIFYFEINEYEKSKKYIEKALKIRKDNFGASSVTYASSLKAYASILHLVQDYAEAEKKGLEVIAILKEKLPNNHPSYLEALNVLALIAMDSKQNEKAWDYVIKAIGYNAGLSLSREVAQWDFDFLSKANYNSLGEIDRSLVTVSNLLELQNKSQYKEDKIKLVELALEIQSKGKNKLTTEEAKLLILNKKSEWLHTAMRTLNKDADAAKALQLVEQNKSVLLLDAASNKQAYISGLLPDSLIKKEQKLQDDYTNTQAALLEKRPEEERDSLQRLFTKINVNLDVLRKQFQQEYPKYAAMKYNASTLR